jgi:hypothetical protein
MSTHTVSPEVPTVRQGRLWFGLLAPPGAWAANELFGYWIASHFCHARDSQAAARVLIVVAAVIALGVAIAAAWVGGNTYRQLASAPMPTRSEARGRAEFMAVCGLFLGVVFAIGIGWSGLPSLLIGGVCEATR